MQIEGKIRSSWNLSVYVAIDSGIKVTETIIPFFSKYILNACLLNQWCLLLVGANACLSLKIMIIENLTDMRIFNVF